MDSPSSLLPSKDTRICLSSAHIGTIKYVGHVDGTQGLWLGVDWDDPCRGRHDGVKDGKQYFSCRVKNAGSFIRPSSSVCYGYSFLRALTTKYIEIAHGPSSHEKITLGSSNGAIEVEAVGLDKIRTKFANLSRLREVSLDSEKVAFSDPEGEINKTCPNVRGLDLSASLLPTWDMVSLIASELPLLERLALNRNRFTPLKNCLNPSNFLKLTELQLNGTMMTWEELTSVIAFMPKLRIVEMGYNTLSHLSSRQSLPAVHAGLEVINFDSNELVDWSHLCHALGPYTSLERLILASNRIMDIAALDNQLSPLHRIKHLALSFNQLHQWLAFDRLYDWCPNLETLSITGNPLLKDLEMGRHARQFVIAQIPSLLMLDSAAISPKERTDCELFYLSYIAKTVRGCQEEKYNEHPQWKALCAKHGKPADVASKKSHEDKLSNLLIRAS
ncbi:hypothetical protein SERLA73DRAFT_60351 [Serpula lacrymans var. lacrymans S7.3]|uniref:CAP-Gly domain-containing protein n=1 Tax=Serpula lacrymans var. lacrymans (strain S7.3) TaxID=936435 RepID=F8Q7W2_SERL3|nr:hypothetical protein SERLA73DRAFT_60351 [Serpula lacrymans var. lacrymans S7.3]